MSETLEITKENVLQAYKNANSKGKGLLTDLFGKKVFQTRVQDRIRTFEDACEELEIDPSEEVPYWNEDESDLNSFQLCIRAFAMLCIIAKALNEGWIPDFTNSSQYKWWPWFRVTNAGFGFSNTNYTASNTNTTIGSRLCSKSDEIATYFGTQFLSIWKVYLMNNAA